MREILFRGKRVDNGEWVYGAVAFATWYLDDKPMTIILPTDTTLYPHCEISGWESVIPETVGQFTGYMDKNGKKVFEDDIIQRYKSEFITPRKYRKPYKVNIKSEFPSSICEYYSAFDCFDERVVYEVIGNIHDNPELLKY